MGLTERERAELAETKKTINNEYVKFISTEIKNILKDVNFPENVNSLDANQKSFIKTMKGLKKNLERFASGKYVYSFEKDLDVYLLNGAPTEYNTLKNANKKYETLMANKEDDGVAIKKDYISDAVKVLSRIQALKYRIEAKKSVKEAREKAIEIEMYKGHVINHEKFLVDQVKYIREKVVTGEEFDYKDIDSNVNKAKETYNSHNRDYEKYLAEMKSELAKDSEDVVNLQNKSKEYFEAISNATLEKKKIETLAASVKSLEDYLVDQEDRYKEWMDEHNKLLDIVKSDDDLIASTQRNIDEMQHFIDQNIEREMEYETDVQENKRNVLAFRQQIERAAELSYLINNEEFAIEKIADKEIRGYAASLMKEFKGKPENFDYFVTEKLERIRKNSVNNKVNIEYNKLDAASRMISYLIVNENKSYDDAKEIITKPSKYNEFIAEKKSKIAEYEGETKEIYKTHKFLKNYQDRLIKIKLLSDPLKEQKKVLEDLKNKYIADRKKHEADLEKHKAVNFKDFEKWSKDNAKVFEDLKNNELVSGVKEVANLDINNRLSEISKIKDAIARQDSYKSFIGEFLRAGNEIKDNLKKRMVDCNESIEKNQALYKKVNDEISGLKKEKEADAERKLGVLNERCKSAKSKLTLWETVSEKRNMMEIKNSQVVKDMVEYNESANKINKNLNKKFVENTLNALLDKYTHLNDARVWRFKDNSSQYNAMVRPLCEILGLPIPAYGDPVKSATINWDKAITSKEKLEECLTLMRKNAEAYKAAKGKENIIHNTRQRYQRLSMADQLMELCDSTLESMKELQAVSGRGIGDKVSVFQQEAKKFFSTEPSEGFKEEDGVKKFDTILNRINKDKIETIDPEVGLPDSNPSKLVAQAPVM